MKSYYQYLYWILPCLFLCPIPTPGWAQTADSINITDHRQGYLSQILEWLPPDRPGYGRVSYLDSTFTDWLERTGELPPDFSRMPSIPDLPDPLLIDEGGENIPVRNQAQWKEKRRWMQQHLQHYITGTFPPPPDNLIAEILHEEMDGKVKLQMVKLSFGPGHEAKLTLELMIPPGEGPFPVFMTQWNHRGWARIAVRRGYIGCVYAGADVKDDTEDYGRIWAGKYDFTRLMRRAWGCFRAIDYLFTLIFVDQDKIALTGHSRNGKQSLMAAAFDERIKAVIPSSGGTGAEVPWRYCSYKYDVEDIALLAPAQPSWLHPRLRFFVGREYKLPVDQNHFMALIAPRGLMLSTATEENASNPWGIEKGYYSAKSVYDFLDSGKSLALRYRNGLHGTTAEDIEAYIDFFDYIFGRTSEKPVRRWNYVSSFDQWQRQSRDKVNPFDFPVQKSVNDPSGGRETGSALADSSIFNQKAILDKIKWILGEEPAGVTNPGPGKLLAGGRNESIFGNVIERPAANSIMARMAVSPYSGFGDYLYGYLYYPREKIGNNEKLPVVIYLHEYDYSKGFSSMGFEHDIDEYINQLVQRGFAVFAFDMLGFGTRQEEGLHFYDRYPHWSKMGKMVADVRGAVDALMNMESIDSNRIYVTGYALGGTVGLYATALDERISGLVSICGFTSMQEGSKNIFHLRDLSEHHMLIPRLGFFLKHPERIPFDYDDLLTTIAPRPVLVVAPTFDQDADNSSVRACVNNANALYESAGAGHRVEILSPPDYNRFSQDMRQEVYKWLDGQKTGDKKIRDLWNQN